MDIMLISGWRCMYPTFQVERHRSSKSLCNIGIFPIRGDETRLEKGIRRSEATGSDFGFRTSTLEKGLHYFRNFCKRTMFTLYLIIVSTMMSE